MRDECEHGSLRRSCRICELETEVAALKSGLGIDPRDPGDIGCRDATIDGLTNLAVEYRARIAELEAQAVPDGWRIVEKATCYALHCGNEVIATLAGPMAEENAATLASLLAAPTPPQAYRMLGQSCACTFDANGKLVDWCKAHADAAQADPIPMVLYCPACGKQHIDAPEVHHVDLALARAGMDAPAPATWTNPPHRSHLCHDCGHIWRPADVPTTGVECVKTQGKNDTPPQTDPTGQAVPDLGYAHEVWRAALTLANNLCVQISDDHNNDDETVEANTASRCARKIRDWLEQDDETLSDLLREAGVAAPTPPSSTGPDDKALDEFLADYVLDSGEGSTYTPDADERFLIRDAIICFMDLYPESCPTPANEQSRARIAELESQRAGRVVDLSGLERYDSEAIEIRVGRPQGDMREAEDGEWLRFEDVEELITNTTPPQADHGATLALNELIRRAEQEDVLFESVLDPGYGKPERFTDDFGEAVAEWIKEQAKTILPFQPNLGAVGNERETFNEWNNNKDCPLAGLTPKQAAWRAWQAARAQLGAVPDERTGEPDQECRESDGCPTERAVLQRFWREHNAALTAAGGRDELAWLDYATLFHAIAAATKTQRGGAIEVSVAAFRAALAAAQPASEPDEPTGYYLQSHHGYVGNCPLWWAKGSNGYTTHLDEAELFTKERVVELLSGLSGRDERAWPAALVREAASLQVDMQRLRAADQAAQEKQS